MTVDPADDDEEVFGAAWPNWCKEWRELKDTHPSRGQGPGVAAASKKGSSTVELALLEEHGLTLPPETYPLKGLDRSSQVNWRRKALDDTQKARKRRELLLWPVATIVDAGVVAPVSGRMVSTGSEAAVATSRQLYSRKFTTLGGGASRGYPGHLVSTSDNFTVVWLFQCFPP